MQLYQQITCTCNIQIKNVLLKDKHYTRMCLAKLHTNTVMLFDSLHPLPPPPPNKINNIQYLQPVDTVILWGNFFLRNTNK